MWRPRVGAWPCSPDYFQRMKQLIKKLIISILPLSFRKTLAQRLNRQQWISSSNRSYWATELLVDFARHDVNAYHKFLWANHLAYAETYEIDQRFGYENFNETRKLLFSDLPAVVEKAGLGSCDEVRSALEVGCSLGYLLRYLETDLFPNAVRLHGIDIDAHAIAEGTRYLGALGSKVDLFRGDMESMGELLGNESYDVVLGSGILLYLDESSAWQMVAKMLSHTNGLLSITALAHPATDNSRLERSVPRERDGTWVHNVDRMITDAGGNVIARRWEGNNMVDGNTVYFVHAVPGSRRPVA